MRLLEARWIKKLLLDITYHRAKSSNSKLVNGHRENLVHIMFQSYFVIIKCIHRLNRDIYDNQDIFFFFPGHDQSQDEKVSNAAK